MGKRIEAENIQITKLENPVIAGNGDAYHYKIEIKFSGSSTNTMRKDLQSALDFARNNSSKYEPSWEEVTMNGRFSCD